MVSSNLWTDIDGSKKAFTCLSVMTVADLLQLLPVREKLIFF